jgi:hypothetical protein
MSKKIIERLKKALEPSGEAKARHAESKAIQAQWEDNFKRQAGLAAQLSRIATSGELLIVAGVRGQRAADHARDTILQEFTAKERHIGIVALQTFEPAQVQWGDFMAVAMQEAGVEVLPTEIYPRQARHQYTPVTKEHAEFLTDASLERAIVRYHDLDTMHKPDALLLVVSGTTMPHESRLDDVTQHFHGLEYRDMSHTGGSAAILESADGVNMQWRQLQPPENWSSSSM